MPQLSKSALIALSSLEGAFIIPSYQRAYRWGRKQVEDLLEDFHEFAMGKGKTFFLQPLVIHRSDKAEKLYELIDGQQRLTSLYLLDALLCHLQGGKERGLHYHIVYESRPGLESFIRELCDDYGAEPESMDESLDFYCLFQARQTILAWLKKKDMGDFLPLFHEKLLNNIKFLWHDSSSEIDSSPAQKFIRMNTGKIPLADGELCRALFLMPRNHDFSADLPSNTFQEKNGFEDIYSRLLYRRRLILAHDWDQIERYLWYEPFWNFIGGGGYKGSARMGLLLELHNNVKATYADEHVCFDIYARAFKNIREGGDAGQAWASLAQSLERLRHWYRSNDYYHWIGFLALMNGYEKLSLLLGKSRELAEDEFRKLLRDEIRKSVGPEGLPPLDELSFQNHYALCKNILFLFNIEYSRRHQGHSPRFPFPAFSLENNTIEHVYARNVESLKEAGDRVQWIEEHGNFIRDLDYGQLRDLKGENGREAMEPEDFLRQKEEILRMADNFIVWARSADKLPEEIMSERFSVVSDALSRFIERHEDDDVHSLYNLALLDHDLNSYFKNSIFAIKQKKLRKRLLKGKTFIPAGTIALFMRHFARGRREAPWWTLEDQEDYRAALREALGEFWPELRESESPLAEYDDGTL